MGGGFGFLGFRIRWKRKRGTGKWYVYTFIDDRPVRALKAKIRALTHKTSQQDLAYVLTRLGQIMRGWASYYKHAVAKHAFSKLDTFTFWRLAHMLRARHGWNWERPQARLHRSVRGCGTRPVRRVLRKVGETLPGDHPALGKRLGRICSVPGLRPGNQDGHLHHQRDRVDQRPAPPRGERPRSLPHRAGCHEVPLPGDHEPGPDREGTPTLDQPVEGPPQRLRHHLRRTPQRRPELTTKISYTVKLALSHFRW
jgi:hypothetical protein